MVTPLPRSHTRVRMRPSSSISANSMLQRSGNSGWRSKAAPRRSTSTAPMSSVNMTKWGLPIEMNVPLTVRPSISTLPSVIVPSAVAIWAGHDSTGVPMSTVTRSVMPAPSRWRRSVLTPESVSRRISVRSVRPRSWRYLPMQREAFPHIMASEPSALKMRMV